MFADESARPEGLHYQPDFISAQEEAALIGNIGALPLAPFQFGIYEGKRRVVFFGSAVRPVAFAARAQQPATPVIGLLSGIEVDDRQLGAVPGSQCNLQPTSIR